MIFPFLAYCQLPYSPCSPSGGKRPDVLGVDVKYKAPNAPAPTFTIPAGTRSIAVFVSSETGLTSTTDEIPQGDEDFITINAVLDLDKKTSSGFVNYAKNTNIDGTGTNVYGWQKVPLGALIPTASKVGDATPDLNNVNFTVTGNTLTITETATGIHSSYFVEFLSPYTNSLNPLEPQIRALLHGTTNANRELVIPIPAGTNVLSISGKGTNSSPLDLNTASGTEEGFSNMRFSIDLQSGLTDGFVTLANGGSVNRRSTYVISDMSSTSTSSFTTSGHITGDYTGKLAVYGGVGVYNPQIYISGSDLIIRRDTGYARDFDDAYVVEFYTRVGQGMSADFIDSDIRYVAKGNITGTSGSIARTFNIPTGTNFIYFNETGNAVNATREANENSLASYAYIDLTAGTATGYFYQQVGLQSATRRDDNYAFKNVPLTGVSTRSHTNTVGYKGPNNYDIAFTLSADKSQLIVTNSAGLVASDYQMLLSADFYGSNPDIAFNTSDITFAKGSSCNIVRATVNVCNPGSGNNSGGMPVAFYYGNPTVDPTARLVHVSTFNQAIAQGECKSFAFDINLSTLPNLNVDLTLIINDNGSFVTGGVGNTVGTPFTLSSLRNQNTGYKECYYDNNLITRTISVNNCPVVNPDPDKSSGAAGLNSYLNYFTAGSVVGAKIVDSDATVTDPDGGMMSSATITITNRLNGANEALYFTGTSTFTITGNGTGTITLTGPGTLAQYAAALKQIDYRNTLASPNTTNRNITISVNDGIENGPLSNTTIVILTNSRINVTGAGITIIDGTTTTNIPDQTDYGVMLPTGAMVTHTFAIQNLGTGTSNLTGAVSSTGDAGFTVVTQPATATAAGTDNPFTVRFNPAGHAVGTYYATITIPNNDPVAALQSYTFRVSATVNTLPTVTDGTVNGFEDTPLQFTAAYFTGQYNDPDGVALNRIRVLSVPLNGSFRVNSTIINVGDEIPAAQLGNIVFTPTLDWNGITGFQWNANDGTSYAAAPAYTTINMAPVNDTPSIVVPISLAVTEDIPVSLKDVGVYDVDAGNGNVLVRFAVLTGAFQAASGAGVTIGGTPSILTLTGTITAINTYLDDNHLTYSSSQNPPATEILTITISDLGNTGAGNVLTRTATVTLGITAVNDAPVGTDDTKTTNQDQAVSGTAIATDVDDTVLTYVRTTNGAHGNAVVSSSGAYTYTPNAGYFGTDVFTITVSDPHGATALITINIVVNAIPVGTGDSKYTNVNTVLHSFVTGTDADGDTLTYTKATDPSHGTVIVHSNGRYDYTPATDYRGPDSFTITLDDGKGGTTTVTVNIIVNAIPVGTGDTKTINENTTLSSHVTGTDADADTLTYTKATDPSHGTVIVYSNGHYEYTPDTDYHGPDSFTITVSDGHGGTTTVIVNITVNAIPSGTGDTKYTNVNTVLHSLVTGTDADGDTLTYTKGTDPSHGTVIVHSNGRYDYTPATDYAGPDSFTITLDDGNGGTTTVTVNITVNTPPTGSNTTEKTNRNTTLSSAVTGTDADGDVLSYTKATDPLHGTVTVDTDGTYDYVPDTDYYGPDSFTITISDGHGGTTTVTVNITVNSVPVGTGDTKYTNINTVLHSFVTGTDADGDTLTYTKATDPSHGTVIVHSNGRYDYTPAINYTGPDSFTITLDDGNGGTTTVTVNITVNTPPTGSNTTETTNQNTTLSSDVTGTDADGDALTYTRATDPPHGTVTVDTDGTYDYVPDTDYYGPDSFTITISDGNGGTTTVTVNITVNAIPTGNNTTETTNRNTTLSSHVTGTDADGDVLTYSKATDPSHGTVTVDTDGTYDYVPATNYTGPDSFTINISDGKGGTTIVTVNITVNTPPTGSNTTETTNQNTSLSGQVTGTDADGDALTYTKATDPSHGTVTVNTDGTYEYVPATNYYGPDSFTITISDSNGGTTTVTVNITVNALPVGTGDTKTTIVDQPVNGAVTATDPDGDPLTFAPGTAPSHGSVTVNTDGTYTYTPATGYLGTDNFTIIVSDGKGGNTTIPVNITIGSGNQPPAGTGGDTELTTNEGTPVTGTITGNDPDGDPVTFTPGTNPSNGTVVVNPDGSYTYTPNPGYTGQDSFTIDINDGKGGVTPVTIEVNILPAPVAADDKGTTQANTPVILEILTNDDAKSSGFDYASLEIVTAPANGVVIVNSDGTVTYTPAAGYTGEDVFTYRVRNTYGFTNIATVTVTISFMSVNVPTMFTPNNDGKNDAFEIRDLQQFAENELTIVNRWGNEVFRSKNYQNNWKGDGLNEGTYYYLLRVKRTANGPWEVVKGYVTLVRTIKN